MLCSVTKKRLDINLLDKYRWTNIEIHKILKRFDVDKKYSQ